MNKPNVIVIMTDDQGYGDTSCHGHPELKTPWMDYLCDNGISLESFHTDPLCAPSRAAFVTGMYSFGTGAFSTVYSRNFVHSDIKTIADYFKEGGYATGMFGKWHLGENYPYAPQYRGFDEVYSFGGGTVACSADYWDNDWFDDTYEVNGELKKFTGYCTDIWFNSAEKFIYKTAAQNKPFFCYIPTNSPHGPCNVAEEYQAPYEHSGRKKFYGSIANIDKNIGELIKGLKEKGLYDNTVIIFFGDNGSGGGAAQDIDSFITSGYNAGMRGRKSSPYEGGHRNSCFITSPKGLLGQPRKVYGLTAQFDLLPTLIDLCGLPNGKNLDGVSICEDLKQGKTEVNKDRTLIVHCMQIINHPTKFKDYTVMNGDWRLVKPYHKIDLPPELYNLKDDPGELHNVADEHQDVIEKLNNIYENWYDSHEGRALEFSYTPLVKDKELCFSCHNWMGVELSYSQRHVRQGINDSGYWKIEILEDGEYEFELCRWPKESKLKLRDTCEMVPATPAKVEKPFGVSYDIVKAEVSVGENQASTCVKPDDYSARLVLNLKKGKYELEGKFTLADKSEIGSYFIYVKAK